MVVGSVKERGVLGWTSGVDTGYCRDEREEAVYVMGCPPRVLSVQTTESLSQTPESSPP
jgi:hypothetical protein